jgi:hypothetical protein
MARNLILGVLVAAVTFGCATTQNTPSSADAKADNAAGKGTSVANLHCPRDTGSRIARPDDNCRNLPGSSYSGQELQDTGELETADALRKLDPRIQ